MFDDIHGGAATFNLQGAVKTAEGLLAAWSAAAAEPARALIVLFAAELSFSLADIADADLEELRQLTEACVEAAQADMRVRGDPAAPPPPEPEAAATRAGKEVDYPTDPAIIANSVVARTREQLQQAAGGEGVEAKAIGDYRRWQAGEPPRSFTPRPWRTGEPPQLARCVVRQPLRLIVNRRAEPSRRLMARRARPAASRAPPGGDSDDPDPDGPDHAGAFFVPWGRR